LFSLRIANALKDVVNLRHGGDELHLIQRWKNENKSKKAVGDTHLGDDAASGG
jgi:hypothetical protein